MRSVRSTLCNVSKRVIIGIALSMIAGTAFAEEITPWSFLGGTPKDANVVQLSNADITPQGLHITTQQDGYIVWNNNPIDGPTDVITVRAQSARPVEGAILWHPKGSTDNNLIQMNFTIPGGGLMQNIDVIVNRYPQWDWQTAQLAIAFPAGSDVTIEELQFRHWPFYERLGEAWMSFWTFDTFRPFSINFLWGPLVATNTPERVALYETLPPFAWSATRYMYGLLGAAVVLGILVGWMRGSKAQGVAVFALVLAGLWLVFDLRMSSEIVSYAADDIQRYVAPPAAQKELRNFGNVYAHIERFIPAIKKEEKFVMMSPIREVYFPISRYLAYPSVIIADPKEATGATLWMILDRTDIWVDTGSMLRMGNDVTLAGPGTIIDKIDASNFLFSTAK